MNDHRHNTRPDVTIMKLLDTRCTCGAAHPGASDEIKEQVFNNVPFQKTIGRFEDSQLYHKARDHLKSARKKIKTRIFDRYLEDERHRDSLHSEGRLSVVPLKQNLSIG